MFSVNLERDEKKQLVYRLNGGGWMFAYNNIPSLDDVLKNAKTVLLKSQHP